VVNDDSASPASEARKLADRGGQLVHPDVISADVQWRSARLFTAEELNFDNISTAIVWMEKLARENVHPRETILNLKRELEVVAASSRAKDSDRQLATEVRQWLTVWLQNPQIFLDWFALRQSSAEFRERFRL
jgi:hypothetical protein